MARANRGSSVLGFSIATVVMAGLLVAGAYTLRQLTVQPAIAQGETPQVQTKPDVDQSNNGKTNTNSQDSQSSQSSGTATGTVNPPSSDSSQTGQLPHTGPSELVGTAMAIGLLSGMVVAYMRSRRPELSL